MKKEIPPNVDPVVRSVANDYGRMGHVYGADHDDFAQELYLWIFNHSEKVKEWLEEEKGVGKLRKALENECKDYLLDVKAQATGYERRDVYFYTVGELKVLLDCVFDQNKWLEPPQSDGRSTKAPAEGNNWVITLADVANALKRVEQTAQDLLRDFHQKGWKNHELAQVNGVSEAAMSYRHAHAVRKLQKELGGPPPSPMRDGDKHDPWRGRHAVSNASARAQVSEDYEED